MKRSARFLPLLFLSLLFGLCLMPPAAYAVDDLYVSGDLGNATTLSANHSYDSILVSGDLTSGDATLIIDGAEINSTGVVPDSLFMIDGVIVQANSGDATLVVENGGSLGVSRDLLIYAKSRDASLDMQAVSKLIVEGNVRISAEGGNAKLVLGTGSVLSADSGVFVNGYSVGHTATLTALSSTPVKAGDFSVNGNSPKSTIVNVAEMTVAAGKQVSFMNNNPGDISVNIGTLTMDVSGGIMLDNTAPSDVVINKLVLTGDVNQKLAVTVQLHSSGSITINNYNAISGRVETPDNEYGETATIKPGSGGEDNPPGDPGDPGGGTPNTPNTPPPRYVPLAGYDAATEKYTYVIFGEFPQNAREATRSTTGTEGVDWVRNKTDDYSVDEIVWRVLEAPGAGKATAKPTALLFSYWNLARSQFANADNDGHNIISNDYAKSIVRAFLVGNDGKGGIFANTAYFSTEEQNAVVPETISNSANPLFLLSSEQLTTAKFGFSAGAQTSDSNRIGLNSAYAASFGGSAQGRADEYWTRTPVSATRIAGVSYNGAVGDIDGVIDAAVRPACYVDLESVIFKSGFDTSKPTDTPGTLENPYVLYVAFAAVPATRATATLSGSNVTITFDQPAMPAYVDKPDLAALAKKFTATDSNNAAVAVTGVAFENGALVLTLAQAPDESCQVAYTPFKAEDTDGIGLLTDRHVVLSMAPLTAGPATSTQTSSNLSSNADQYDVTVTAQTNSGSGTSARAAAAAAGYLVELRTPFAVTGSVSRVKATMTNLSSVEAKVVSAADLNEVQSTARGADDLYLLITGTAPDIETVLASSLKSVSYWLVGDESTEYRQDFSPALALSEMNIDLPEESTSGSGGGCGDTGVGTPLAMLLAIGFAIKRRR